MLQQQRVSPAFPSRRWPVLLAVAALAGAPINHVLGQTSINDLTHLTRSIEVFTTAGEPVANVPEGVAVIELDAPARLDAEISHGLPDDPEAAMAMIEERMHSPEWQQAASRYGDLYTGVARAWLLRVEKVPAVVVDGEYVVYGQPNVAAAVQEVLQHREGGQ